MTRLDDHTNMIQWYYIEDDSKTEKLAAYPPDVNFILETALKDQKHNASYVDQNGNRYVVDFNSYTEHPEDNQYDTVKVVRKSKHFGEK